MLNVFFQLIITVATTMASTALNVIISVLMFIFWIPIYFIRFIFKNGIYSVFYLPGMIIVLFACYMAIRYFCSVIVNQLWDYANGRYGFNLM